MTIPAIEAAALRDVMRQVSAEMPGAPAMPLRVGEVIAGKVMLMPDGQRGLSIGGVLIPATLPGDLPLGEPMKLQVTQSSGDRLVLNVIRNDQVVDTGRGATQLPGSVAGPPSAPASPAGSAASTPTPLGGAAASSTLSASPATGADALKGVLGLDPAQVAEQAQALQPPYANLPMPGGAQARIWVNPDGGQGDEVDATRVRDRARSMVIRYDSPTIGRVDVVLRMDPNKLEATVLAQAGHPIAQIRAAVPELRAALTAATPDRTVALSTGGRVQEAVNVRA